MKIWNSKYALTKGVIEQEGEAIEDSVFKIGPSEYLHGEGKDWHRTIEGAVARAEVMRKAKIASMRKQLARLESLRFDAYGKLAAVGRDKHFTDAATSSQDKAAGDEVSSVIGDLYINWEKQSPADQWTQVMKALRVHGFKIGFSG